VPGRIQAAAAWCSPVALADIADALRGDGLSFKHPVGAPSRRSARTTRLDEHPQPVVGGQADDPPLPVGAPGVQPSAARASHSACHVGCWLPAHPDSADGISGVLKAGIGRPCCESRGARPGASAPHIRPHWGRPVPSSLIALPSTTVWAVRPGLLGAWSPVALRGERQCAATLATRSCPDHAPFSSL
jgi:hypothetical protein